MNVYTQAMPEGKRAANRVVVRSVLPFASCGGVTALSGGREWEPIATGELLNALRGVELNHRPLSYEQTETVRLTKSRSGTPGNRIL
jgi:hypothetical protein